MKIIKQTVTELIIQTRGVFDFWLPSCLLIVFGLSWLAFEYDVATLKCQRLETKQGSCQLRRSNLLGSNLQEIQLASLQGSQVTKCGYISKVVLLTNVGNIPLTANSNNWGEQDAIASNINSFIQNADRKFLDLSQDNRWLGWIGGTSLLIGIWIILCGNNETYQFDKTLDILTIKRRGFLKHQVTKQSLSNIYGVEIEKTKDLDDDIWYEVKLLVSEGNRRSLSSTMNQYQQQKIAKAINNYLNARSS